jgi:hypothetical protein
MRSCSSPQVVNGLSCPAMTAQRFAARFRCEPVVVVPIPRGTPRNPRNSEELEKGHAHGIIPAHEMDTNAAVVVRLCCGRSDG